MPRTKRPKPLYQRGKYTLYPRGDRANLEIVWYDTERKRERSTSAGTADVEAGKLALDRVFLDDSGSKHCPTCHRPWDNTESPPLASVIADYLLLLSGRAGERSAKGRLSHVVRFIMEQAPDTRCIDVDERWVARFRKWLLEKPVISPNKNFTRARSIGAVEGSVLQLAAAINATPGQTAAFKPEQPKTVSKSPSYRADIKTLAAMFRFALAEEHRINLLRYLRMGVATWARPDAIFDARPEQWHSSARVLDLNTPNRKQTKKHRPKVPVPCQFADFLDSGDAFLTATMVRSTWEKMRIELDLPLGRESGEKLIRRSVATIARKRIGEANWRQGEMMLGHVKASVSDIYALPDPANLGLALAATESIIDDIEKLAPGAFKSGAYRTVTAKQAGVRLVKGGKNG